MSTVLITGGTGMIGKRLTELLINKGYQVIILTRGQTSVTSNQSSVSYAQWNIEKQTIDVDAIQKADHIIHLAGAGVADKRWTTKRKKEIVDSRVQSSKLIVKAVTEIPNTIKTVVSTSAIGWYGADTKDSLQNGFDEDANADTEFLGTTCKLWEESISAVESVNKRLVKLRVGIVLSNAGGALAEFRKPMQMGIAAILGNGKQIISWVHVDDLCNMFIYAIEHEEMNGVFNAVAPNPVSNKTLTLTLAKIMKGNFFIPFYVPAFLLKIILGEMSVEVLKSATVNANKIKKAGYVFLYPTIETALKQLFKK
jgi:hypothetical protein